MLCLRSRFGTRSRRQIQSLERGVDKQSQLQERGMVARSDFSGQIRVRCGRPCMTEKPPAPTGDKVRCNCDRLLAVPVENVWVLAAYKWIPTEELMQPPLALLPFSAVAGTAEVRNWLYRSRCINSRRPNGIPRVRSRDYRPNAQIQCRLRRNCQPTASGRVRQFGVIAESNLLDLH